MLSAMESSSFVCLSKNKRGDTFFPNPPKARYSLQIIFCALSKKKPRQLFCGTQDLHFFLTHFSLVSNDFFFYKKQLIFFNLKVLPRLL